MRNGQLTIADCRFKARRGERGRSAFTLVEAVMSMLIVSVMLVSAMRAAGSSGLVQYKSAERATGRLLASGLLNDIMPLAYRDPGTTPVFGTESGESTTSKAAWNDVDDFNGWTESPPQDRDGNVMSDLTGWSRSVTVDRVDAANPSQVSAVPTGAKRITVTVRHNNLVVATRVGIRTSAP